MKGNAGIVAIFGIVLGSLLLLMVLTQIVDPLTQFQPAGGQLANLTGYGYIDLPEIPANNINVYNNTDCVTDQLNYSDDFMVDAPYDGYISLDDDTFVAGIHGLAVNFSRDGDYVAVPNTPNINGDFTLTGWIKPST